jgi:hypothetical protein
MSDISNQEKQQISLILDSISKITELRTEDEDWCDMHKMSVWDVKNSNNQDIACSQSCHGCAAHTIIKQIYIEGFLNERR